MGRLASSNRKGSREFTVDCSPWLVYSIHLLKLYLFTSQPDYASRRQLRHPIYYIHDIEAVCPNNHANGPTTSLDNHLWHWRRRGPHHSLHNHASRVRFSGSFRFFSPLTSIQCDQNSNAVSRSPCPISKFLPLCISYIYRRRVTPVLDRYHAQIDEARCECFCCQAAEMFTQNV